MLAKVDNIEDSKLKIETDKLPTFEYQKYFHSPMDASTKLKRLLELFRKSEDNCSSPSTDSTFPQSNEDKKRYVEKLFNAINDWENINEWSQTLVPEERNRVIDEHRRMKEEANGATPDKKPNDIPLDEIRPSRDDLPTLDVQQKKILGRQLNDQTVEWLCWELIVGILFFAPPTRRYKGCMSGQLTHLSRKLPYNRSRDIPRYLTGAAPMELRKPMRRLHSVSMRCVLP